MDQKSDLDTYVSFTPSLSYSCVRVHIIILVSILAWIKQLLPTGRDSVFPLSGLLKGAVVHKIINLQIASLL